MEKAHQSGKGLGKALIYMFIETISIDIKSLQFYEFNNIFNLNMILTPPPLTHVHAFFLSFNFGEILT